MARELTDRVMVITGASSGIGAATAVACAQAGIDLVLSGRDANRLDAVAQRVRQAGRRAVCVAGDVTDEGMSARLLDTAEHEFGQFDFVFANAGYGFKKPFHEVTESEHRRIFEVNYFAACDLIQQAARRLVAARRPGHLLMCSSAVARLTMPAFAAYSATKAAQHHVCRSMDMDLRKQNIRVSSVHPIGTRTGFFDTAKGIGAEIGGARDKVGGPAWTQQPPERVARGVVACLRRPRPEVWTSFSVRLAAGLMTTFPRMMSLAARFG